MTYKKIPQLTPKQENWLLTRIETQSAGCHEFQGKVYDGRGKISLNGSVFLASRVFYFLHFKVDPAEFCVCHTCDNPKCLNPDHLFLGTIADNMRDKTLKMRGATKLTTAEVREIRYLKNVRGFTYGQLKIKFGVTKSALHGIVNNKTWKFV